MGSFIPHNSASTTGTYNPEFFRLLLEVEDRHFWFRVRNRVIAGQVRQCTRSLEAGYRVLEVGCGTGNVLHVLERWCSDGKVVGMDLFEEGLALARRRCACSLVQGDLQQPPFGSGFQLIGLFDVLEHIPDDRSVLAALAGLLVDGGTLLLTVPAGPELWSYFDEASCHCRRYLADDLRCKLEEAGLRVEYLTHYMAFIYPLVRIGRQLAAARPRRDGNKNTYVRDLAADELRVVPILNGLLAWILSQEARLLKWRVRLPFGTSLLAAARKVSQSSG